jgi:uncharacterized protein RhaS with RHS repeats
LYYFRARWYDPETGRWLSKDPIGIRGGLNQYVSFGNNPVNFVDPFGLDEDSWMPALPDGPVVVTGNEPLSQEVLDSILILEGLQGMVGLGLADNPFDAVDSGLGLAGAISEMAERAEDHNNYVDSLWPGSSGPPANWP